MLVLGLLTAIGLYALRVPFWLPFGVFSGLAAIIPFFGTLVSTTLPALFVLNGTGFGSLDPFGHSLLVVGLGVVVHLIEAVLAFVIACDRLLELAQALAEAATHLRQPLGAKQDQGEKSEQDDLRHSDKSRH